jgi:ornithine carbamoyltransferase
MDKKDFLKVSDYSKTDIEEVFETAKEIKAKTKKGVEYYPLKGKTLGMIFNKPSTRTRVSFEVGMYQLGGYPLFLSSAELQLNRGESIGDTAQVLSRFLDGIMIRTFSHKDVEELAAKATIPVINGLTDDHHPCQILADIFTLLEKRSSLKGLTITWVGDGNNVLRSWMEACPILGMNLRMAVPKGYEIAPDILKAAQNEAKKAGTEMVLTNNAMEAVKNTDVIYGDVWTSMGQEAENAKRLKDFADFQINSKLLANASKDVLFMHCLPAHRGEDVTDEVIDGPHSIVFDEAENRMHLQKGILALHLTRSVIGGSFV